MHTHILPSLDDGAGNMKVAVSMARIAAGDKIGTLVATPHVIRGVFESSKEEILAAIGNLNGELLQQEIPVRVMAGAEYYLEPDLPERNRSGQLMTINDTGRYLLVELPAEQVPHYTGQILYELQLQGITPIIAHPERNAGFMRHPEQLGELCSRGIVAQGTAASFTGEFGNSIRKAAVDFLQHGWIHMIASDAHSDRGRPPVLSEAAAVLKTLLGSDQWSAIMMVNPQQVIQGLPVEQVGPAGPKYFWQRWFGK